MQSNQTPPNTTTNFADAKSFYETYIDHRRGLIFLAIALIIIGLIIFFQVCGAEASGSDPSGIAGSSVGSSNKDDDGDSLNPYAVGFFEFAGMFLVVIGSGILAYYMAVVNSSKRLIDANNLYGAALINAQKGKGPSPELMAYQLKLIEQDAIRMGVNPIQVPIEKPEPQKGKSASRKRSDSVSSSSSSSSGSDTESEASTPPKRSSKKNK